MVIDMGFGRYFLRIVIIVVLASRTVVAQTELPKVMVIATGGTIAGEQKEPGTLDGYEIKKSVNEIVAMVPEVKKYAQVETEQFLNIASTSITPQHWIQLAKRINDLLATRNDL